jgi:hypothetical protein
VQLIGSQQQYDKCLREHQQHASADALDDAMAAIAADVNQLQARAQSATA